jgi:uncharacterized phage protein (TIGR01671 family)
MREIKFRYKVHEYTHLIYDSDAEFGYLVPERTLMAYGADILHVEYEMQYTGFRDKNGNDIYKHDIVRRIWDIEGSIMERKDDALIVFENGSWGIRWINPGHPDDRGFKSLWSCEDNEMQWDLSEFEIIGNKHENPELLKGN